MISFYMSFSIKAQETVNIEAKNRGIADFQEN